MAFEMSEDHDNSEQNRKSRSSLVWIWMPVLYVLSIGPAGRLHDLINSEFPTGARSLEFVYYPLKFIGDRLPMFRDLIGKYMELWR